MTMTKYIGLSARRRLAVLKSNNVQHRIMEDEKRFKKEKIKFKIKSEPHVEHEVSFKKKTKKKRKSDVEVQYVKKTTVKENVNLVKKKKRASDSADNIISEHCAVSENADSSKLLKKKNKRRLGVVAVKEYNEDDGFKLEKSKCKKKRKSELVCLDISTTEESVQETEGQKKHKRKKPKSYDEVDEVCEVNVGETEPQDEISEVVKVNENKRHSEIKSKCKKKRKSELVILDISSPEVSVQETDGQKKHKRKKLKSYDEIDEICEVNVGETEPQDEISEVIKVNENKSHSEIKSKCKKKRKPELVILDISSPEVSVQETEGQKKHKRKKLKSYDEIDEICEVNVGETEPQDEISEVIKVIENKSHSEIKSKCKKKRKSKLVILDISSTEDSVQETEAQKKHKRKKPKSYDELDGACGVNVGKTEPQDEISEVVKVNENKRHSEIKSKCKRKRKFDLVCLDISSTEESVQETEGQKKHKRKKPKFYDEVDEACGVNVGKTEPQDEMSNVVKVNENKRHSEIKSKCKKERKLELVCLDISSTEESVQETEAQKKQKRKKPKSDDEVDEVCEVNVGETEPQDEISDVFKVNENKFDDEFAGSKTMHTRKKNAQNGRDQFVVDVKENFKNSGNYHEMPSSLFNGFNDYGNDRQEHQKRQEEKDNATKNFDSGDDSIQSMPLELNSNEGLGFINLHEEEKTVENGYSARVHRKVDKRKLRKQLVTEIDHEEDINSFEITIDWELPILHTLPTLKWNENVRRMIEENGIELKSGNWSREEELILQRNWEELKELYDIKNPLLFLGIEKTRNRNRQKLNFLKFLGKDLNCRPLVAVYAQARKMLNPRHYNGGVSDLQKEAIYRMVEKYGHKWERIGRNLGIPGYAVKNAYNLRKKLNSNCGTWSAAEEKRLTKALIKLTGEKNLSQLEMTNLPWLKVSEKVKTRNSSQCREHWLGLTCRSYNPREKDVQPWTAELKIEFLKRLESGDYQDETEIPWTDIVDEFGFASTFILRQKWFRMKTKVPLYYLKTYKELLDYLMEFYYPILLEKLDILSKTEF
ncbi:Homeobox protein Nkx-2.1 [Chamberlinius hualienensis]